MIAIQMEVVFHGRNQEKSTDGTVGSLLCGVAAGSVFVDSLPASAAAVVQTIGVGNSPAAVSSDGSHVWVANSNDNTVTELDASTGVVGSVR